jgi:RecA-family ATPase
MTTMTKAPQSGLETITLGQLLDHPFRPREDLISPWLRQGESAMMWAAPGTGKTLLALTMAVMVAGGGSALGWSSPKPRRVLFCDGEMSAEDLKERAAWLIGTVEGVDQGAARENLLILSRNWQKPDVRFPDMGKRETKDGKPSDQDVYLQVARKHRAELVIADNFSTLAEVSDENEAAAMTPVLAFLLRLKQARIACILVHHSGKDGSNYRGSSRPYSSQGRDSLADVA